jgi:integrase
MRVGRIRGINGCGRGTGFDTALQVLWGLRRERLSFNLCLAGFSVGGDTLNGGIPTLAIARPMPSRYQACRKDDGNATLGLVGALLHKAKGTQELHTICITKLVNSFDHMKAAGILPHHIYAYLDANPAKIAGNRQLSVMSSIFNLGILKGLISANPCKQVKRNPEKPRDRYIEDAEFAAVKALATPQMAAIMDFAMMTAMRRGDIVRLRMDQIHADGIAVTQGKTGKRQFIEWTPALRACVEKLKAFGPPLRPTLICAARSKPYTVGGFYAGWRRVMLRAVAEGIACHLS